MSAPRRLLDDPSLPEELRADLRVAAQAESGYDSERGLLALQAAVATLGHTPPLPPSVDGGTGSATASGTASGTQAASGAATAGKAGAMAKVAGTLAAASSKLTVALVVATVGLGVAGTVAWLSRGPELPATRTAPATVAPARAVSPSASAPQLEPAPAPVPAPAPDAVPEPVSAAEPAAITPHALHPRLQHAAPAPVDPDLALRDEIDHLARVKALLERDPRAAYELAQAGNRTLSSMFRQERDGLSALALDAAGEHARARRLARAFVARHPDSPLRARVAALLEPERGKP